MENTIKIILSLLFFLCLAKMPYSYYELVRLAALVGFAILAFRSYRQGREIEMVIFGALALLFQPFFKLALGREMWNVVDVVVGVGLIVSIWVKSEGKDAD